MSKLLIDKDGLLLFCRDLACIKEIGINGAIFLQQLHYWLDINKKGYMKGDENYLDKYNYGKFWTYNTLDKWQTENFPFWSMSTLRRTIDNLIKHEYVIIDNFNKKGFDQTLWYTINYEKLQEKEREIENLRAKREAESIAKIQKKNSARARRKMVQDAEKTHLSKMNKCDEHSLVQNEQMQLSNVDKCYVQNEQMQLSNMNRPIPNTTTKTSSQISSEDFLATQLDIVRSENNINLIESNTHLNLSKNMVKKVLKWDNHRLTKAIEIFKDKEGEYFALLEKIYKDDGNFVPKNATCDNNSRRGNYTSNNSKRFKNQSSTLRDKKYYDDLEDDLTSWLHEE